MRWYRRRATCFVRWLTCTIRSTASRAWSTTTHATTTTCPPTHGPEPGTTLTRSLANFDYFVFSYLYCVLKHISLQIYKLFFHEAEKTHAANIGSGRGRGIALFSHCLKTLPSIWFRVVSWHQTRFLLLRLGLRPGPCWRAYCAPPDLAGFRVRFVAESKRKEDWRDKTRDQKDRGRDSWGIGGRRRERQKKELERKGRIAPLIGPLLTKSYPPLHVAG